MRHTRASMTILTLHPQLATSFHRQGSPLSPEGWHCLSRWCFDGDHQGDAGLATSGGLSLGIDLTPLFDEQSGMVQSWWTPRAVHVQQTHDTTWLAHDGQHALAVCLMEEPQGQDIRTATKQAYAQLSAAIHDADYGHVLRTWNYFDAITEGDGDEERYKQFCVGRAEGLGAGHQVALFPAATAIGTVRGNRWLQVIALASKQPGQALENPRQTSAYHYPRQYGKQSPSFARAMRYPATEPSSVLLSGTASVVGHETKHEHQTQAQFSEVLTNIQALLAESGSAKASLGQGSLLKVYARSKQAAQAAKELLHARFPELTDDQVLWLDGRVCRRDLLIEMDGEQLF